MKYIASILMLLVASVASAQVTIKSNEFGSGEPGSSSQTATQWDNNLYHAPQYMAGYPTAATIFPRVIDVPCTKVAGKVECAGYNWLPEMGRAEYLLIRPIVKEVPPAPRVAPPKKKAE